MEIRKEAENNDVPYIY